MPHQNTDSEKATAQNAATEPQPPNDAARGQHRTVHAEPRSYTATDFRDASLASPAAGEVGDYADLGAPSGGMAQGRDHNDREAHAHSAEQGPKTRAANRAQVKGEGRS